MKNKKYVLMTIENDYKYEGFVRHHFKLFESYKELQYHLLKFHNTPGYIIFEETNQKKDKSFIIDKSFKGNNFCE